MSYALGRSVYQNRARKNGICSQCYRNPVEINPRTNEFKWKCGNCEKKQTLWQKENRIGNRNEKRDMEVKKRREQLW